MILVLFSSSLEKNVDKKVGHCVLLEIHVTSTILGQGATQGRRVQENMEKESRRQSGQLSAYECSRWQKRGTSRRFIILPTKHINTNTELSIPN